jgi:peptidoglycan/LPS O-acetylase OafA/YrhL
LVGRLSMKGIGIAAAIMLVAANLIRMLLYVFIHPQNESIWFNTFTHLDPLALGVLLAVLLRTKRLSLNGRGRALVFGVSFVALLAVSRYAELNWNSAPLSTLGLFGYPAVALSCFGIVAATLGVSTRFVRSDALTYLGKISYGLYVYHLLGFWMAERLFRQLRGFHIVLYPIAALCFTIVLGSISYRFLESPFLRLKKRFTYVPSRPL